MTGVDISDEAIDFARRLSGDSGIAATFERDDVFAWLEQAAQGGRSFDRVFSSYGAILWLSDLEAWARGIAGVLKPGGHFALLEFHPFAMVFDPQWKPHYDYFGGAPLEEAGVGDYVALSGDGLTPGDSHQGVVDFQNPHRSYEFAWGVGDVVSALLAAGLRLERLIEYPYANGWRGFERMADIGGRRMVPPEDKPRIPLMYGLVASKPA